MVMLSLPVILLGIIVIEQLVVIIMLIVMNCKIKKHLFYNANRGIMNDFL